MISFSASTHSGKKAVAVNLMTRKFRLFALFASQI